jgi:hypothetical protein
MSRDSLDEAVHGELSLAEWFALAEDERGELVDGRLVEEEAPNYVHEILVILLGSLLRGWFAPRGGFVGGSDAKLVVGPKQGRRPDLTVYFAGTPCLPPAASSHNRPTSLSRTSPRHPATAAGLGSRRWRTMPPSGCATTESSILSFAAWRSWGGVPKAATSTSSALRKARSTFPAATASSWISMPSGLRSSASRLANQEPSKARRSNCAVAG